MIRSLLNDFRSNWRPLLVTDLMMKIVAFTFLTPLIGFAFDGFLEFSGRSFLADTDIAYFLLHPIGWCAAIVVGGGILAIFAIGLLLLAWSLLSLLTNSLAVTSLSLVLVRLYLASADRGGRLIALTAPSGGRVAINMTRGRIAAVLAVGCILAGLAGARAIHGIRLEDNVQITAHRGASGKAPENTLAAVHQAIADRADWVEIDVQETKDGVVVVAHDSDLKKLSGVNTKIWDATAAELRSIDIGSRFDPSFAGERVPTLAEVLEACVAFLVLVGIYAIRLASA